MSAVAKNMSEPWKEPADDTLVNAILASARHGLVVLCEAAPQFDASIHSLLAASLQEFSALDQKNLESNTRENKPPINKFQGNNFTLRPGNYPLLVLHTTSLGLSTCDRIVKAIPSILPVVLFYDEGAAAPDDLTGEQIVATICNNEHAGQTWQNFRTQRDKNHAQLIVLDFLDPLNYEPLRDHLVSRLFQVVTASERLATTFSRSHIGSQLLVIEACAPVDDVVEYLYRLRLSHESDALGIVVSGNFADPQSRCALLEAGADDLLDSGMPNIEVTLRLQALARQQTRAQQIRCDAYRFPGSVAYNADFLANVGNKLYASAQRDVITMALAMIRVSFVKTDSTALLSSQERAEVLQVVANYCTKNLRETDLFAQCGERDFIVLVTCVGRNNIARVFKRLSEEVIDLVDRSSRGRAAVKLHIGATPELGVSFNSMMTRAQQALVKAENQPDNWLVIN